MLISRLAFSVLQLFSVSACTTGHHRSACHRDRLPHFDPASPGCDKGGGGLSGLHKWGIQSSWSQYIVSYDSSEGYLEPVSPKSPLRPPNMAHETAAASSSSGSRTFSTESYFQTQRPPAGLEEKIGRVKEFVDRWQAVEGKKVVLVTVSYIFHSLCAHSLIQYTEWGHNCTPRGQHVSICIEWFIMKWGV